MLAENRRPRNIYHLLRHPQGDFNLQRVLLITIYSWGRDRTSRGSSGCRFFGSPVGLARGTEVLLRGMLVLGNRAPSGLTALDALLAIYQL